MGAEEGTPASRYLAGGLSEKGRRESNEDAAILAVLPPSSALRAFAVLCDGMGGHNAGEVASRLTVEILKEKVQAFAARPDAQSLPPPAIEAEIREWIAEVNREIYQRGKASAEQKGMGTTLAFAMVLADDRLVVANVGDSRIFLVSGLSVRQLSVDHTALAEQRRALGSDSVAPEDDASNPFAHALTRSLGQEKKVDPGRAQRRDARLRATSSSSRPTASPTFSRPSASSRRSRRREASRRRPRRSIASPSRQARRTTSPSRSFRAARPPGSGVGKAGPPATRRPAPSPSGDGMLVAGAASAPVAEPAPPRARAGVAALGVAALALLAVVLALGFFLRRSRAPRGPPAAAPSAAAPPSTASAAGGAPAAADAASRRSLASSPAAETPPQPGARMPATPRPSPQPARAPAEPSFRTPAALSGPQASRVSADADRDADRDPHADADARRATPTSLRPRPRERRRGPRRLPPVPTPRADALNRQRPKTRKAARAHAATKARIPRPRTSPPTSGPRADSGKQRLLRRTALGAPAPRRAAG